jgi:DNA-binding response OmpR family regulator
MTDYLEKGLRAIEEQYNLTPKGRNAVTRIKAIMYEAEADGDLPRHIEVEVHERPTLYIHPYFDFHIDQGFVSIGSENIMLTPTECRILNELASNPNVMVPRANLLRHVRSLYAGLEVDPRVVAQHISHMRGKLDSHSEPGSESVIRTVRNNGFGSGYMLIDHSRAPFATPQIEEQQS